MEGELHMSANHAAVLLKDSDGAGGSVRGF